MTMRWTVASWLLVSLLHGAAGDLTSSSSVEQCLNTGEEEMDCDEKMVVTLSLESNQNATETLIFSLDQAEDANGRIRRIYPAWSITMVKSEVQYRYPLEFVESFNAQPYELVVHTGKDFLSSSCDDNRNSASTSCGWARTPDGLKVDDSQGFCCGCGFSFGNVPRRGQESDCSALSYTAHCFRHGTLWYSAHNISPSHTFFTIKIIVDRKDGNVTSTETLVLSPETTGDATSDGEVVARLQGDYAPYIDLPTFENKMLFVPSRPPTHERVAEGMKAAMLVNREKVDGTGLTCDKIGVSYSAFKSQANECDQTAGACLSNQLEDLHKEGESFLTEFGVPIMHREADDAEYLSFLASERRTSVITLTVNADHVKFIISVGKAKIVNITIANFETQSNDGMLRVQLESIVNIQADFSVAVVNCTDGIMGIHDKNINLGPKASGWVWFDVRSERIGSGQYMCMVQVRNSMEDIIDRRWIKFWTYPRVDPPAPNNPDVGPNTTMNMPKDDRSCLSKCDGILDLFCLLWKGCWEVMGIMVAVVSGTVFLGPRVVRMALRQCKNGFFSRNNTRKQFQPKRLPPSSENHIDRDFFVMTE